MPDQIERFGWVLGADGEHGGIDRRDDGEYVRYSDYEKLKAERDFEKGRKEAAIEVGADVGVKLRESRKQRDEELRERLEEQFAKHRLLRQVRREILDSIFSEGGE